MAYEVVGKKKGIRKLGGAAVWQAGKNPPEAFLNAGNVCVDQPGNYSQVGCIYGEGLFFWNCNYGETETLYITYNGITYEKSHTCGNRKIVIDANISPFAVVSNAGEDTLTFFSVLDQSVIDTIDVGDTPGSVRLSPSGFYAFVMNNGDDTVSVVNTLTRTIVETIPVGDAPGI